MRNLSVLLLTASLAISATAQRPYGPPPPSFASLTDQPARHTGFVFDRNMMQSAQSLLEQNGMDAHRATAAVTGVSFDQYHFQQPAFYTPEAMFTLMEGYRASGWKHLVNQSQTPAQIAQPRTMATDLWLHFSGADIDAVTVLTRGPLDMNVVQLTGDLRPLDLLHLSGHFGIPKIDPDAVMVPDRR